MQQHHHLDRPAPRRGSLHRAAAALSTASLVLTAATCGGGRDAPPPPQDGGADASTRDADAGPPDVPAHEVEGADGDAGAASDTGDTGVAGRCVWNLAYQENTEPDSLAAALDPANGAHGCYVLVDPFDDDAVAAAIPSLQAAGNVVGCYVSVGTCEDWRADFADLKPACTAEQWPQWPGEFFVRDTDAARPWMEARIQRLAAWGCDLMELDNMDWAEDPAGAAQYGLSVTPPDAVAYYQGLCAFARARGVGCVAKSTAEGALDFDGMTVESSPDELDWWDHEAFRGFADAGKLAVIFHYGEADCAGAEAFYRARYGVGMSWLCEDPSAGGYVHD